MADIKVIFAQTNVRDTEEVVRVADLLAYINEKMPRHTSFMSDYDKGKEDILDDIKYEIEKPATF